MDNIYYYIFDVRAMNKEIEDEAICLYTADNLKDAKEWQKEFGACVIGKSTLDGPIEMMYETFYNGK